MENYNDFNKRMQAEINALPIIFVFGQSAFDERQRQAGGKLIPVGAGGYCLPADHGLIKGTFERHEVERREALQDEGFARQAIRYELANHEGDLHDALQSLGIDEEQAGDEPLRSIIAAVCNRFKTVW